MSDEFERLDPRIQKWVYQQKWSDLRDIQKQAIEPILRGQQDVIISASTAAGKTEAFFLPACTAVADQQDGFSILYISPLKALINDQYRRLESLCESIDIVVTPWHGDSHQTKKNKAKKDPSGILMITPESLEARLIRHSGWVRRAFSSLQYIVIDEFHAFIGSERGVHLLSLLSRIEALLRLGQVQEQIPRIALSATLGNLEQVPKSLRPNGLLPCTIITGKNSHARLKAQIRGFVDPLNASLESSVQSAETQICETLYKVCRGDSHLVFANSRAKTEMIAAQLSDLCERDFVPNEFFPHHGSLAKELRETLESRLQKEKLPTTAICTMTLELGIDIGKVNSVAQVTAPHSVASLRQRLGRSGRRDSSAILRMLIPEKELTRDSSIADKLRLQLLQSIAMLRLLIASKWFEPADTKLFHFSTLLHQVLAMTAQWGGIQVQQLYRVLCKKGPFVRVSASHFKLLLRHMGKAELITQLSSGEIVLGIEGERLVNQYTFYAVFKTPEEYRLVAGNQTLGSLPVDSPLYAGQHIIFGGRRWSIIEINAQNKTVYVEATKGGRPPMFIGGGLAIHERIRQEMFQIYIQGDYRIRSGDAYLDFLNPTARELFSEGLQFFNALKLDKEWIVQQGQEVYLLPWMGDQFIHTLVTILVRSGLNANTFAGVIEIEKTSKNEVMERLREFLSQPLPSNTDLAKNISNLETEKYDFLLPTELLTEGYGAKFFDVDSAVAWLQARLLSDF